MRTGWVPMLCLAALAACTARPPEVRCDAPAGIPDASILLFGEMHGSAETPDLVGRVVCQLATQGPTALALEIGVDEQARLDAFLTSDGGERARAALLEGDFWRSRDGRSSTAKLDLLEYVRALKHGDLPVEVFAFIPRAEDRPQGVTHDEGMAREIRAFHSRDPGTRIVALMGNVHAMQSVIEDDDFRLEPTGHFLTDLDAVSILVTYPPGSIWACMPDCGLHTLERTWGDGRREGFTDETPRAGYGMSYVLPSITASPPALDTPVQDRN